MTGEAPVLRSADSSGERARVRIGCAHHVVKQDEEPFLDFHLAACLGFIFRTFRGAKQGRVNTARVQAQGGGTARSMAKLSTTCAMLREVAEWWRLGCDALRSMSQPSRNSDRWPSTRLSPAGAQHVFTAQHGTALEPIQKYDQTWSVYTASATSFFKSYRSSQGSSHDAKRQ